MGLLLLHLEHPDLHTTPEETCSIREPAFLTTFRIPIHRGAELHECFEIHFLLLLGHL